MAKASSKKELPKEDKVIEVEQPVSEFAVREIMVQKQISREEAIEVLKTPSK